jgi:hypothetical protein
VSGVCSCNGQLLPGTIIDVDNEADLLTALAFAGAGNTVRLAPGEYALFGQAWTGDGLVNWPASIVLPVNVTLAGWGPSQTRIYLEGPSSGITGLNGSTLRDLSVVALGPRAINTIVDAHLFTVCNVQVGTNNGYHALDIVANDGGFFEAQVHHSTFVCTAPGTSKCDTAAIAVYSAIPGNVTPGTIGVVSRFTSTIGWTTGIEGMQLFPEDADIIFDLDCTMIFGSEHNAVIWEPSGPQEYCP